jgi:uncharacterized protein YjbI with pentapeptide repeats
MYPRALPIAINLRTIASWASSLLSLVSLVSFFPADLPASFTGAALLSFAFGAGFAGATAFAGALVAFTGADLTGALLAGLVVFEPDDFAGAALTGDFLAGAFLEAAALAGAGFDFIGTFVFDFVFIFACGFSFFVGFDFFALDLEAIESHPFDFSVAVLDPPNRLSH